MEVVLLVSALAAAPSTGDKLHIRLVPEVTVARSTVQIEVKGCLRPDALRFAISAGTLSGSGTTRTLKLPDSNAPRTVAVAVTDGIAHGSAYLPVVGSTALPVETRRGARISVTVAGRTFGPIEAKRRRIEVPIEVPPGVRTATVTARDKLGNERHEVVDLRIPDLARLAALLPSLRVAAGSRVTFPIALGSSDGRRSAKPPRLTASAGAAEVRRHGDGWVGSLTAPLTLGSAWIQVDAALSSGGSVRLEYEVVPGAPAKIVLDPPIAALRPVTETLTQIAAHDSAGNVVIKPITVRSSEVDVSLEGSTLRIRSRAKVPVSREAVLVFDVGGLPLEKTVTLRSGTPMKATISARERGRSAGLTVRVYDDEGNAVVEPDAVEIASVGLSTATLSLADDGFEGMAVADATTRAASIDIVSGQRVLGSHPLRFDPPASAYLLAAYVSVGYNQNLLSFTAARLGLGLGLRKGFGPVELGLFGGGEMLRYTQTEARVVGGVAGSLASSTTLIAVPFELRGRLPIGYWFGVGAAAALAPTLAVSRVQFDDSESADSRTWLLAGRGLLFADVRVGPGRLALGGGYGRGELSRRELSGELEGAFGRIWYEFHFVDLGG